METDIPLKHSHKSKSGRGWEKTALKVFIVLVLIAGAFYGGIAYQKHQKTSPSTNSTFASRFGSGGSFEGGNSGSRPVFGDITSVNGSSFTMTNTRSGTSTTVQTDSSTQYSGGSASSLVTGVTVIVRGTTSSSGTIQATNIIINPSGGSSGYSNPQSNDATPPSPSED